MALAIFDLDDTLIDGNSPSLWSEHLGQLGWLDPESFLNQEQALVAAYAKGQASLEDYLAHTLQPLVGRSLEEVSYVANAFVELVIEPLIHSDAMRCVSAHRQANDQILIISATPSFLVQAIAERLGIEQAIGTDLAFSHGLINGQIDGIGCAREGKIAKLEQWLTQHPQSLLGAHFYSDSINDLPLLRHIEIPHAVNPDAALAEYAKAHDWHIHEWR